MKKKLPLRKKRKSPRENNTIDKPKLFFIFFGTIFILFGMFIGDVKILDFIFPFYLPILFGVFLQISSVIIFVKQKQIKI